MGEDSILDVEKAKMFFARTAWISCSLSWKPMDRKGKNQSPGISAWWIFRRWSCIPCTEQYASYYIRDYYVRLDQTDDRMEVEAVYAPERK